MGLKMDLTVVSNYLLGTPAHLLPSQQLESLAPTLGTWPLHTFNRYDSYSSVFYFTFIVIFEISILGPAQSLTLHYY